MGNIVISQNVSLDGVVEDPTGESGFEHGGWFDRFMTADDRPAWAAIEFAEAQSAKALLLGRRSDNYFGSRWNDATGDWADRLRALPKYVVSSTLKNPVWVNSTVLSGDVGDDVSRLKDEIDGDIVVYASRELVQTLLARDLVDELRLIVFPVVLGSGKRLFGGTFDPKALRLLDAKPVGGNLSYVAYAVVRED
ncbi:dihydrofolate reductase family protein [Leifsonia poae]|uniref:dihydrofolate reductase family protein n=1 Tax=Leifsonia poae TaxID=110933 RepID=UPI003D66A8DF